MIHVRTIETIDLDPGSRQELDRNFMHTGYRRRLMVATDPSFAWKGRPMRSGQPMLLVPIPLGTVGSCTLRYLDHDGTVRTVSMAAGRYYNLPAGVPYQIEANGAGALEMFVPAPADGRLFDEEPLPEDFFTAREAAGAGVSGSEVLSA
jgi:hypothetical protein